MTDISHLRRAPNGPVASLVPTAFVGMLAMVVADTAFAESLRHIQTEIQIQKELSKRKVRAGSLPGHPDKMLPYKTKVPPPAPPPAPTTSIKRSPNPDEPGYVAPAPRGTVHRYHDPVCHDGTCESE